MEKTTKESIEQRRTYYSISNNSPISDKEIKEILDFTVKHAPSAFNSQSARVVLLLGEHHKKLWNMVLESLKKIVSPDSFAPTQARIDSFSAGYGTILFFEDTTVVKNLQQSFPLYADNFPVWSEHSTAIHQILIWMLLEEKGLGVSLQHYGNLIESQAIKHWNLPSTWRLTAQMPFGTPTAPALPKTFEPLEHRVLVFD